MCSNLVPLPPTTDLILPNFSKLFFSVQTRGEEIEKCQDGRLEPTYHFSIFKGNNKLVWKMLFDF